MPIDRSPARPHRSLSFSLLPLAADRAIARCPQAAAAPAPSTIPALFLSDIHLDPFSDPAKVAQLDAAPASEWPAILAAPASPTQPADFAALQQACPVRGIDTPDALWRSSLAAIRANAAHARFVTISGDLLAHSFDCKYRALCLGQARRLPRLHRKDRSVHRLHLARSPPRRPYLYGDGQ